MLQSLGASSISFAPELQNSHVGVMVEMLRGLLFFIIFCKCPRDFYRLLLYFFRVSVINVKTGQVCKSVPFVTFTLYK